MLKEIVGYCQLGFAAVGGALGWFVGGLDGFLYALIAFVVIDYLTGLLAAGVQKKLSSEVGFKGIAKKIAIFLLVGIANIIDVDVIQNGTALRTAVIFFYLSNEGLSILENAGNIGLPIPEKLKTMLSQLKDKEDPEK
ncbi:holin family protein [Evtepia sp.]|jgi:toxin secretion/phage lysis holin|uniref:phage holin family protein n=1 Tax=Evtepia sp. TaxID=2773933 RepID=UPI0039906710